MGKTLRAVIGRFVLERKHNVIKGHVIHLFRHVEYTTTVSYLNAWWSALVNDEYQYGPRFLINARSMLIDDPSSHAQVAVSAEFKIGLVKRGDVVQAHDDTGALIVGEVQLLFAFEAQLFACKVLFKTYTQLVAYDTEPILSEWQSAAESCTLLDASMIGSHVVWATRRRGIIIAIEIPRFS